jgi:predicted unusual protein kinase regulating ubiquinone biosynthesis (AarF/ABC1/UbiB family)
MAHGALQAPHASSTAGAGARGARRGARAHGARAGAPAAATRAAATTTRARARGGRLVCAAAAGGDSIAAQLAKQAAAALSELKVAPPALPTLPALPTSLPPLPHVALPASFLDALPAGWASSASAQLSGVAHALEAYAAAAASAAGDAAAGLGAAASGAVPPQLLPAEALVSAAAQQLLGYATRNAVDAPLIVALLALSAGAGLAVGAASPSRRSASASASASANTRAYDADVLPSVYDPAALAAYYGRRPGVLLARQASLARETGAFVASLLLDKQTGAWEKNMPRRAATLRALIVAQGAAFIKVGQALAIRPDILPPPYLEEFAKLLDQVPPFEAIEAQAALRAALAARGLTPEAVFVDMAAFDTPVAAASIGQVYQAALRPAPGSPPDAAPVRVAVKLQRPDILSAMTLDLHIIRQSVLSLAALPAPLAHVARQASSFIEVLDVAATRFLEELDYEAEASNSVRFETLMSASTAVRDSIVVPHVFTPLSSRGVLVQSWIDGTKLSDIPRDTPEGKATRARLVRTLLLSYMTQLLETGFLHGDPHPGNFLLTPDGRVAILDYGMVTEITQEQRYAFLEYMAHLSAKQYDRTIEDLVALGFVPSELSTDPAKRAIVAPAIASTLEILYGSGGGLSADKVTALTAQSRVAALSEELKEISRKYPVSLPPYFVLILRAFGTLEGLGIGVESSFAILDECFPYIARRLLTDDSPRVRGALRTFAYGASDRLSVERIELIANGLKSFNETMDNTTRALPPPAGVAGAAGAADASPQAQLAAQLAARQRSGGGVDAGTLEVLSVLFAPQGNYVQQLLLEEATRAVDALSRDALLALWSATAGAAAAAPLRALVSPALLSFLPPPAAPLLSFLSARPQPPLALSGEDQETLATLRRLTSLLLPLPAAAPLGAASLQLDVRAIVDSARAVAPLLPVVAPGLAAMGQRFARMLAQRMLTRAAEDLGMSAAAIGAAAEQQQPGAAPRLPAGGAVGR